MNNMKAYKFTYTEHVKRINHLMTCSHTRRGEIPEDEFDFGALSSEISMIYVQ